MHFISISEFLILKVENLSREFEISFAFAKEKYGNKTCLIGRADSEEGEPACHGSPEPLRFEGEKLGSGVEPCTPSICQQPNAMPTHSYRHEMLVLTQQQRWHF